MKIALLHIIVNQKCIHMFTLNLNIWCRYDVHIPFNKIWECLYFTLFSINYFHYTLDGFDDIFIEHKHIFGLCCKDYKLQSLWSKSIMSQMSTFSLFSFSEFNTARIIKLQPISHISPQIHVLLFSFLTYFPFF